MTDAEQIAYLRERCDDARYPLGEEAIRAVCDLAERALLTDEEAKDAWFDIRGANGAVMSPGTRAVLRRLLPDERVEHRYEGCLGDFGGSGWRAQCSCGTAIDGPTLDAAVRAWADHAGITPNIVPERNPSAHAGIGGTE